MDATMQGSTYKSTFLIFQAKQKLSSISRATKHPVSSEDLIKYGHRISASNAVCAPPNWQQGDTRRPYPTGKIFNEFQRMKDRLNHFLSSDLEMRSGLLGRPDAAAVAAAQAAAAHPHSGQTPSGGDGGGGGGHGGSPTKGGFAWKDGEMGLVTKDGGHVAIEGGGGNKDEVEVMSTDSSSSSSTDSN